MDQGEKVAGYPGEGWDNEDEREGEEEEMLDLVDSSDEEDAEQEEEEEERQEDKEDKMKLSGEERAALRSILTGAVKHGHFMFQSGYWKEDRCRFCGQGVKEDSEHMWWQCGAWDQVRKKHLKEGDQEETQRQALSVHN